MTNNRFEELERRCTKLKKTRIIRMVFAIAFLFLIGFGVYYGISHHPQEVTIVVDKTTPKRLISLPIVSDQNESNISMTKEEVTIPKDVNAEALFLAPHIYKNGAKLPQEEAQEAKRSLSEEELLQKKFSVEQNFTNAYALAYFYFERKAYSEVIIWAKEASKHNSRSDKPWILYAKAKFHLGERTEAIRSLELFLGYINSKEAQDLLNFYKGQE